jgi:hypothetical protein
MPTDERPLRPPNEVCPVKGPGHLTTAAMQVDTGKPTAPVGRQCESDAWLAGLHRRRVAAARSVPLDCGCCRDPLLPCQCSQPALSVHAVDSWRDAALHIIEQGYMPLVPIEVRRALFRRGGRERQLAGLLHRGCEGRVA